MQNKIKVLHLSSEKTWRGGEQQIAYLIDELKDAGVINHAVVRHHSAFESHCQKNDIPYQALPFRNTLDFITALAVSNYCRHAGIDIIHVHSAKSHGIAVLAAAMGNKTPIVLSRRVDFIPKDNLITRWRYNHRSIRAILGVSEKITSIMKSFVNRPEICVTVHSGIDTTRFESQSAKKMLRDEYRIPSHHKVIGNTSALADHKDYPTFLATIAELVRRKVPVSAFIVGHGEQEHELKAKASAMGLEEIVLFTGFRKDLNEVLRSFDIFLMPSKTEGLGTSVLDAFACSVPVVATRAGGIPEMVEHEVSGMLGEVGDSKTLADHITRVLDDPHLRERIILGAKHKLSNFSKKATAEKTLKVYQRVLDGQAIS